MTAVTRIWHRTFVAGAIAISMVGCVSATTAKRQSEQNKTLAVLAAARANRINMFGDLGEAGESQYSARTAISMRQHTFAEIGADADVDIDAAGRRLIFSSTRHHSAADLYMKAVDGVAVTQITSDPAADVQPAFSPDGTRVAFASRRTGSWDIWITSTGGDPPVQVTNGDSDEVHPSWSPDGEQLVYCSRPRGGGQWELWIANASAGSSKRFIGYGLFPEWSPAGSTIVYQRARERGTHWFSIWTLTLVNGEPRYPTEIAARASQAMILPTWSADGRRIAFASTPQAPDVSGGVLAANETGVFDIWIMQADGRGKSRLTDGHTFNSAPVFGLGDRIFFTSDRSGHDNLWSLLPGGGIDGMSSGDVVTFESFRTPMGRPRDAALTASPADGS